mmetsp:Transcript_166690/g.320005  ORF Transcript_166690/g.320005 Transcript_166690/m.320005 type:complete len:701 (+) Transcript_166690:1-2103(+)
MLAQAQVFWPASRLACSRTNGAMAPAWGIALAGAVVMITSASAARASVTPVQKVIEMLDGLLSKGEALMHAEQVEYAKVKEWCESEVGERTERIEVATAAIEELTADIAKASSDAEALDVEVTSLASRISTLEEERSNATTQRSMENTGFKATAADLAESIDAIVGAIAELKAKSALVPLSSSSFIQLSTSRFIDAESKALMDSYAALNADDDDSAPQPNAYEFQSGGVLDLLERLLIKFKDQKSSLESEEANKKFNFEKLSQGLTDEIESSKIILSKKTELQASRQKEAALKNGEKTVQTRAKLTDENALSNTQAQCMSKSKEYQQNQATRADEKTIVTEAIEILSSEHVSGNADKYLQRSAMIQETTALVQLQSVGGRGDLPDIVESVAAFLQSRAVKVNSKYLELIAVRVQADPLMKVKQMIKELIVKLMREANSEQDRHSYCQAELATNAQTREIKSSEVEELTAKLQQAKAESEQLQSSISAVSDAIAEITKSQEEEAKIRIESKATHATTVGDAKAAQLAISKAIQVLKDFYQPGGNSALLQGARRSDDAAEETMQITDGKPYAGMTSSGSNILAMLDVIMSDFARLQAEAEKAEDADRAAHAKFMDESDIDLAVKKTEQEHLSSNKDKAYQEIRSLTKELENTQTELDAALNYQVKLHADCVETGLSYEARARKREEEIGSLQEALKMLAASP